MSLPKIVMTMGDPSGISLEIVMKALVGSDVYRFCLPVVIGDAKRLALAGRIVFSPPGIRLIRSMKDAKSDLGHV